MKRDEPLTLGKIYRSPDPLTSLEEYERHEHRDLSRRPRADLLRERERIRFRLLIDDEPDPWLVTRLQRLDEALAGPRTPRHG